MIARPQQNTRSASARGQRRGTIVVLTAVMIIAFLASVAFSLDVAYMQLTKAKLRAATDAAARAGGEGLSRVQDIDFARQAAKDIAMANQVAGEPLLLDDSDIIFGRSAQEPSGAWAFTPGGSPTNAVRVFGRRTGDSLSGSVPIFFGRVFNVLDFEPVSSATVVRLDRDIVLVVDRSSSMKVFLDDPSASLPQNDPRRCSPPDMNQSRWGALSVAVDRFVDALDQTPQTEHVALVSYAGSGNYGCNSNRPTVITNSPLSEDETEVSSAMADLSQEVWQGWTNIGAGVSRGTEELTSASARPYAAKTIVLMSDGVATQPGNCVSGCSQASNAAMSAAFQAADQDVTIHTVSFGEADRDLMQAIADTTGGNHYIAPDAQTLQDIFEEIALTLPVMFTD